MNKTERAEQIAQMGLEKRKELYENHDRRYFELTCLVQDLLNTFNLSYGSSSANLAYIKAQIVGYIDSDSPFYVQDDELRKVFEDVAKRWRLKK